MPQAVNKFLQAVERRIEQERDERMTAAKASELPEYDHDAYRDFYRQRRVEARREQMLGQRSKARRKDWFQVAMQAAKDRNRTLLIEAQGHLTQRDLDKLSQWMAENRLV